MHTVAQYIAGALALAYGLWYFRTRIKDHIESTCETTCGVRDHGRIKNSTCKRS